MGKSFNGLMTKFGQLLQGMAKGTLTKTTFLSDFKFLLPNMEPLEYLKEKVSFFPRGKVCNWSHECLKLVT